MQKKRPTIRDVSEAAGVSTCTVSRALNGHNVRAEIKARVLQAAADLDYTPNVFARSMRRRQKDSIAILVTRDYEQSSYLHTIAYHVIRRASERGFKSMLEFWDPGSDSPPTCLQYVDGFVLLRPVPQDSLRVLQEAGSPPLVSCGEPIAYGNSVTVSVDGRDGFRRAVTDLLALGHEHIGMVIKHKEVPSITNRYEGYCDALTNAGKPLRTELVRAFTEHTSHSPDLAHACTRELLTEHPEITAIVYTTDSLALAGLDAIKTLGKRVPEDVSVVGYGNLGWTLDCCPLLASIGTDPRAQAETILDNLQKLVAKIPGTREVTIPTTFIRRASVGPAPRST